MQWKFIETGKQYQYKPFIKDFIEKFKYKTHLFTNKNEKDTFECQDKIKSRKEKWKKIHFQRPSKIADVKKVANHYYRRYESDSLILA